MNDQEATAEPTDADRHAAAAGSFKRLALIVLGGLALLVIVTGGTMASMYWAATAGVPEYDAVLPIDPVVAEPARRELESRLSTLFSDAQTLSEWSTVLTQTQVNAWLAARLPTQHPGFARSGVTQPRVRIAGDGVTLMFRSEASRLPGVVRVAVRPQAGDEGELVLRVDSATFGTLPMPLDALVAQLRETPLAKVAPVRWSQTEAETALVLDLERIDAGGGRTLRIVGIDVRDGELLVRGESLEPAASAE
ncbi:MAG: hypothetical protein AAF805_05800 [Planctomycetota bacterium]